MQYKIKLQNLEEYLRHNNIKYKIDIRERRLNSPLTIMVWIKDRKLDRQILELSEEIGMLKNILFGQLTTFNYKQCEYPTEFKMHDYSYFEQTDEGMIIVLEEWDDIQDIRNYCNPDGTSKKMRFKSHEN